MWKETWELKNERDVVSRGRPMGELGDLECLLDNISSHFPRSIHQHHLFKDMLHLSNKVTARCTGECY